MDPKSEILFEMYKSQVSRSEHYESLRSTLVNFLFVVSGILVSIAVFDDKISSADIWVGSTLAILGLFGLAASAAHGRRSWRHGKRAAAYRNALDAEVPAAHINDIRNSVPKKRTYLNVIWNLIPAIITVLGIAIIIMSATAQK